jgi:hypothetical protein
LIGSGSGEVCGSIDTSPPLRGPILATYACMTDSRACHDGGWHPGVAETSRWKRPVRALAIALLRGAAAGVIAAALLTVVEAEGLVIPLRPDW